MQWLIQRIKYERIRRTWKMNAPFDVTGVVLETERLILRPWEMADVSDFLTFTGDPDVTRSVGWEPCVDLE